MQTTTRNFRISQELANERTVEVLYQKMGNRWFAFSMIGDDVFVGSISQEQIDATLRTSNDPSSRLLVGNS